VTVDRQVAGSFFDDDQLSAGIIPATYITALAVAPGGCWPMALDGSVDLAAVRRYQQAALSDDGFAAWLQAEVLHPQAAPA
jgi:glutaconate CoA-transferase subunit A